MKKMMTLLMTTTLVMGLSPTHANDSEYLPILGFAAGLLNQGVFPQSDLYTTDDDIVIVADDGVELTANIFVPNQIDYLAPAVVFINSWALNEYEYLTQAGELAEKGYIVLSYTTRGFGESGGLIDTAGPKDMADFSKVLDFLIDNYPVDPEAIGAGGISYGSGISLLGAAHDNRVKAVAAMSTWGDLVEALYSNNTPRQAWGALLNLSSQLIGNPDPIINQHWQNIKSQNLAEIENVKAWAAVRSPINYVDQLNANGTAVYIGKAYGDNLFQPNSVLDMFAQLTGPKYIDLVPGTHASAELLPSLASIGDNRLWDSTYLWFDLHLKNEQNRLADAPPVNMQVKFTGRTDRFEAFPVPQTNLQKLFLHPRSFLDSGDLETYQYASWFGADNSINAWAGTQFSTQVPLLSQLLEQLEIPIIADISAASDVRSIYYSSDMLWAPMKLRGNPSVKIQVQPYYHSAQLVFYLYDVDALGFGRLITHGVYTLPESKSGEKITLSLDLITTAYDIPAGHRVALAIDTQDPQYKTPNSASYYIDIEYSSNQQNILKLPTL